MSGKPSSKTNVNARLTLKRAIDQMHRPGTRLCKMHSKQGPIWLLVPGGVISDDVANALIDLPNVAGSADALFPHMHQTWRVLPSARAAA
jgi:hypothetical protein